MAAKGCPGRSKVSAPRKRPDFNISSYFENGKKEKLKFFSVTKVLLTKTKTVATTAAATTTAAVAAATAATTGAQSGKTATTVATAGTTAAWIIAILRPSAWGKMFEPDFE